MVTVFELIQYIEFNSKGEGIGPQRRGGGFCRVDEAQGVPSPERVYLPLRIHQLTFRSRFKPTRRRVTATFGASRTMPRGQRRSNITLLRSRIPRLSESNVRSYYGQVFSQYRARFQVSVHRTFDPSGFACAQCHVTQRSRVGKIRSQRHVGTRDAPLRNHSPVG